MAAANTDLQIAGNTLLTSILAALGSVPSGGATSANQTNGAQQSQRVDGSGNVAPAGDVAARAEFVRLTDGTSTTAVKAASTAPAQADPATVVTLSPNPFVHSEGAAFALDAENGFWVTGSPVGADNATLLAPVALSDVPANRRIKAQYRSGMQAVAGANLNLRTVVVAGTSITVTVWFYDATLAKWVQLLTSTTQNAGVFGVTAANLQPILGALLHVAVATVTGAVTAVGVVCG